MINRSLFIQFIKNIANNNSEVVVCFHSLVINRIYIKLCIPSVYCFGNPNTNSNFVKLVGTPRTYEILMSVKLTALKTY